MKAKELYNYIYSHAISNRSLYGAWGKRDGVFVDYIRKNVLKPSSIFDASCGRGFLLKWLTADGYNVKGSEIADWLLKPGGDLYGYPVIELAYKDLSKLNDKFDVVVSNDVLEHLDTENDVLDAMKQLVNISNKWVLISTGGTRAAANPFRIETGVGHLHYVIKPYDWWKDLYEKYCVIDESYERAGSQFFFGTKR